jgi:cell division protein ZapA
MKNVIRLEILGREFTIRSDEGEERVKKIGEYVNQKIQEITNNGKTVSTLNAAILAALNIANEYFELQERQRALTRSVEDKSGHLVELIHSAMKRE